MSSIIPARVNLSMASSVAVSMQASSFPGYDANLRAGDDIALRLFIRSGSFALRSTVEAGFGQQNMIRRGCQRHVAPFHLPYLVKEVGG